MGKWIVCSLLATLLVLAVSAAKSGNTPVGTELVPATTPYSPGVLAGGSLYISGLQGTDPQTRTLPGDFGQEVTNCLENVGPC
jgi:enamine deaminase RidA (YjgF/YER057c/UK114 family)